MTYLSGRRGSRSPYGTSENMWDNVPTPDPINDDPMLQGSGPLEATTSRELSVVPAFIYDVNGYYRTLGIDPNAIPKPTRANLRRAFYELQPRGPEDEWITFCFQQLFNPVVRAKYDMSPFGSTFFDRFEADKAYKKAKAEALKKMQERGDDLLDDDILSAEMKEIYDNMGMGVDGDEDEDQDAPSPAFGYAYYLWRTRLKRDDQVLVLGEWQSLLVSAFAEREVHIKFAVGFHGRMAQSWLLARAGLREVFFLHHLETPTQELAQALVAAWVREYEPSKTPSLEAR